MRERTQLILVIFLVSFTFLFLVLDSETEFMGKAISIFTSSNVMVSPQIIIIYTKFSGATTPFVTMDFNELQAVDNVTVEIPLYGKMEFDGTINITACMDSESVVNFNQYMGITTNSVTINTTGLPCINHSATISLYQISFNQPRILKDGEPCNATECQIISYTRGILLKFNVTGFSTYEITTYSVDDAAPSVPTTPAPGPTAPIPAGPLVFNFSVDKDFFKVVLKQGDTLLDTLTIKNTGTANLRLSIDIDHLKKYVMLSEDLFYLDPGESKTISIAFSAAEDDPEDVYPGRFIISANSLKEFVLVVVEVSERAPLFDILVSTDETPQGVLQGEEIEADILIYNFGDLAPVDVSLFYSIRDFDGKDILFADETFAVDEQKSVTRRIRIPENFEPGYYLYYAKLTYENSSASSSALMLVKATATPFLIEGYILWLLLLVIAILVVIILIPHMLRKKRRSQNKPEKKPLKPAKHPEPVKIKPLKLKPIEMKSAKLSNRLKTIQMEVKREIIKMKARKRGRRRELGVDDLVTRWENEARRKKRRKSI